MKPIGKNSIASLVSIVLNIAWGLVALGLILAVLLAIIAPFVDGRADQPVEVDASWLVVGTHMTIPVAFSVDARTHKISASALGVEEAQIQDARGRLRFPARPGAFFVANVALLILTFTFGLLVLGQLRAVFRTLRAGQPFVPANARRIRWIGAAVIAGELARSAIVFFENYYVMANFAGEGLRFETRVDLNVFAIVLGLIILAIAEVFAAGTRLDEDQSLTI